MCGSCRWRVFCRNCPLLGVSCLEGRWLMLPLRCGSEYGCGLSMFALTIAEANCTRDHRLCLRSHRDLPSSKYWLCDPAKRKLVCHWQNHTHAPFYLFPLSQYSDPCWQTHSTALHLDSDKRQSFQLTSILHLKSIQLHKFAAKTQSFWTKNSRFLSANRVSILSDNFSHLKHWNLISIPKSAFNVFDTQMSYDLLICLLFDFLDRHLSCNQYCGLTVYHFVLVNSQNFIF